MWTALQTKQIVTVLCLWLQLRNWALQTARNVSQEIKQDFESKDPWSQTTMQVHHFIPILMSYLANMPSKVRLTVNLRAIVQTKILLAENDIS